MQLIKVYSNKQSFKTVNFNPNGLSFILAKQKLPGVKEKGKTYNGVGKSLLVRILHFCFGASSKDYELFCDKLESWEFYLDFRIGVEDFTIKRATESPDVIILNNESFVFYNT